MFKVSQPQHCDFFFQLCMRADVFVDFEYFGCYFADVMSFVVVVAAAIYAVAFVVFRCLSYMFSGSFAIRRCANSLDMIHFI